MATTSKTKATANLQDEVLNNDATVINPTITDNDNWVIEFSWDNLMSDANEGKTREDILKECLADKKRFKMFNGLIVKNVKAFARISTRSNRLTTRLTFVTKQQLPGMVRDEQHLDAFGDPTLRIGASNNVFSSAYAVAGAMKETAKGALFADAVSNMTAIVTDASREVEIVGKNNIANILYAGGTIDVLCQIVPANTPYVNPFSRTSADDEETTFEENRVIHHIVALRFGEAGDDYYRSMLIG